MKEKTNHMSCFAMLSYFEEKSTSVNVIKSGDLVFYKLLWGSKKSDRQSQKNDGESESLESKC